MWNFEKYVDALPADRLESPLASALYDRDQNIMNTVRQAIADRNVLLAFQPVVQTSRPDCPAFYEGLIRIMDRTGRIIPAGQFIDAVETSETGRQIDCLSLELGLQTLAENPGLRLAINMSARSIGYPPWLKVLGRGLQGDATIAERLILEITESSAMIVPDTVRVFMADLQKKGIAFALDDFGAGFTSFRYLRDFHFDILKIDGQFIRDIHKSPDNQILAQALISIGRHFEMFTVANFVETSADAEFLADIGVDCMQGFYFGQPTTVPTWGMKAEQKKAS